MPLRFRGKDLPERLTERSSCMRVGRVHGAANVDEELIMAYGIAFGAVRRLGTARTAG
jgi:hypothetical protein